MPQFIHWLFGLKILKNILPLNPTVDSSIAMFYLAQNISETVSLYVLSPHLLSSFI
jgi:hypothetical protein